MSVVGGVVLAVVGSFEVGDAVADRSTLESVVPGSSTVYLLFGAITLIAGVSIVLLGFRLRTDPMSARSSGNAIIVLSLVSLLGGGGLYLGLVLSFVGGLLARAWRAPNMSQAGGGFPGHISKVGQPANGSVESGPPVWRG